MMHLSFRYRRRRTPQQMREFRAAQARRIAKRWEKAQAKKASEPIRKTRVTEITVRDTVLPMRTIRIVRDPTARGWGRATVYENDARLPRKVGARQLGLMIAQWL